MVRTWNSNHSLNLFLYSFAWESISVGGGVIVTCSKFPISDIQKQFHNKIKRSGIIKSTCVSKKNTGFKIFKPEGSAFS